MQISYKLTLQEFRALQRYHRWGTPLRIVFRIIVHLVLLSIAAQMSWGYFQPTPPGLFPVFLFLKLFVAVCIYLFMELVMFLLIRLSTWREYRSSLLRDGLTITISPQLLCSETKKSKSEFKWEAVFRVVKNSDLILLYVEKRMAVVIPTRAFDSEDTLRGFMTLIDDYRGSSQETSS